MAAPLRDDLGDTPALAGPPRRVVSLVPSLTEAVALTAPEVLVGATDWCTHPADLAVARVGGSKFPSLAAVRDLAPDLILANVEENRRQDIDELRAAGIPVWVTFPRTLPAALDSLARMLAMLGCGRPAWLAEAEAAWAEAAWAEAAGAGAGREATAGVPRRRAVVPVWRRPWVVLGSDTFAGDLLAWLGVDNVYATAAERYPRPTLAELRAARPDLVVLPDEPYAFTADDGPEAFPGTPCALVSGRHLTWYGPSLAEAPALLRAQLARTVLASPPGG